eukprot:COSAG05_NODE_1832_length_3998_cov_11.418312_3_plen_100_part_00
MSGQLTKSRADGSLGYMYVHVSYARLPCMCVTYAKNIPAHSLGIWADEAPFEVKLLTNSTIWEMWEGTKCFDPTKLIVGHKINQYPPPAYMDLSWMPLA